MGSTIQDQLAANGEKLKAVLKERAQEVYGPHAPSEEPVNGANGAVAGVMIANAVEEKHVSPSPLPRDDSEFAAIIQNRIQERKARRQKAVIAQGAEDTALREYRERLRQNEQSLRALYAEKPEAEKLLASAKEQLANAGTGREIAVYQARVDAYMSDVRAIGEDIAMIEREYPELKAELERERQIVAAHLQFLERFAAMTVDEKTRYVTKATPTPCMDNLDAAEKFLDASIEEACKGRFIVPPAQGQTASFVARNGERFVPGYPQLVEGMLVCRALSEYQKAVQQALHEELRYWAEKDVEAGLLLTPEDVEKQKKDPCNRRTMVSLLREGDGFCFIPIQSPRPTELAAYNRAYPEIRVECGENTQGTKKFVLRVTAVTVPQHVKGFFFPPTNGGKSKLPTFFLDNLHEIAAWKGLHPTLRDSLAYAVRWAEGRERAMVVMEELADISQVGDLKTIHQLADGASGTAVIHAPKTKRGDAHDIGFQIVSDGVTVRPGARATDRSKKLLVYEMMLDGVPASTFFARSADGSFLNEELQEIAVRNEPFELEWLMPLAMAEYAHAGIEEVTRANAADMVMPFDAGGRNGTYLFRVPVSEKLGEREVHHEVAYVVRRTDDNLTFITGLTHYSAAKLVREGFALNAPYALAELKGFVLHVFQKAYGRTLDIPYDEFPPHLKRARAQAHEDAPKPESVSAK